MRLAFFVQMLDPQDTIRGFIPGWAKALAAEVDELIVISQEMKPFDAHLLGTNIKVFSLGKEEKLGKLSQLFRLSKILCCDAGPLDAVLTHMNPAYTLGAKPICLMKGIPLYTWYAHKEVSARLKWATRFSRLCFSASEESFRYVHPKRRIIGHGIDVEHFSSGLKDQTHSETFKIVSACRLSPVKKVESLIEAVKGLEGDWHLTIAGDAPKTDQEKYAADLKQQCATLGDKVTWLGAVSYQDMPQHLVQSDLYVNLSQTGSLDKGVLEAVATGLNVLTTNVAFKKFLTGTEERSFLENASPDALRDRLKELQMIHKGQLATDRALLQERLMKEHSLSHLAQTLVGQIKDSLNK